MRAICLYYFDHLVSLRMPWLVLSDGKVLHQFILVEPYEGLTYFYLVVYFCLKYPLEGIWRR